MANQLPALAEATTFALHRASAQPFGPSFIAAFQALHDRTEGFDGPLAVAPGDHFVVPWEYFDLYGPTRDLAQASRTMARYSELHNRVVRLFSIHGTALGALGDGPPAADPLWQMWLEFASAAHRRADEASRRLRVVALCDYATVDAIGVARRLPEGSPARNAWVRAAQNLAELAAAGAREAAQSETAMSSAVFLQCWVGLVLLMP